MTTTGYLVVGIIIGLAAGLLLTWLWWRARFHQLRAERDAATSETITAITQASAKAAADAAAYQFRELEERTERAATQDLERRQQALDATVESLVRPVKEQLETYQQQVEQFQSRGAMLHGELKGFLQNLATANTDLQRETRNLVGALRRPDVRGTWGEQQLRRIIEWSGMIEHCDFDEQVHMSDSSGTRQRPDVIVHLPNDRNVIIDAKVPLDAFLDGIDTDDKAVRDAAMARHAAQLRTHVDGLAKKEYWKGYEGSVDFVVAFVPGDHLLAAAFEHDPSIFQRALENQVIIATPTTLIALLKAVAFGWQQEAAARDAREIIKAGRELYGRVRTMSGHIVRLGRSLGASVDAYNQFVSSLETRVIPQARRFEQLDVVSGGEEGLVEPTLLTGLPRQLIAPEMMTQVED